MRICIVLSYTTGQHHFFRLRPSPKSYYNYPNRYPSIGRRSSVSPRTVLEESEGDSGEKIREIPELISLSGY